MALPLEHDDLLYKARHECRDGDGGSKLQRTFSQRCYSIFDEQNVVEAFDAMEVYHTCAFFQHCSQGFLCELVKAGGDPAHLGKSVPSRELVYKKEDHGHSLYIVARGTAEILRCGRDEELICPGGYFGEKQVLGIFARCQETVRAKTSLHLLEVTEAVLTKLLKRTRGDLAKEDMAMYGQAFGMLLNHKGTGLNDNHCLYHDERRHFENEAMRIYRHVAAEGVHSRKAHAEESFLNTWGKHKRDSLIDTRQVMVKARGREHLLGRLVESIRADIRSGFKLPAGNVFKGGSGRGLGSASSSRSPNMSRTSPLLARSTQLPSTGRTKQAQAGSSPISKYALPSPSVSCMSSRKASSSQAGSNDDSASVANLDDKSDNDEGSSNAKANDDDYRVEVECLPALSDLGSVQKCKLFRQLKKKAQPKTWKPSAPKKPGNGYSSSMPSKGDVGFSSVCSA